MISVIVLFPKIEEAKAVRNLLVRHGFSVAAVCSTGAQALAAAHNLDEGIVVCGYKYPDMMYEQLNSCLPPCFEMLLVVSQKVWNECSGSGIMCISMPLKVHDFLNTLEMMSAQIVRRKKRRKAEPKRRSQEEQDVLKQAKELLMERNNMTEAEAHRYIQKCSMDSGNNLVETAQMVMSMLNF